MAEMNRTKERGYTVTLTVAEYDARKARIRELEAALTRAADTFADLAKVSSMLGRTRMSEACCVAEGDARNVLAGSAPSAATVPNRGGECG